MPHSDNTHVFTVEGRFDMVMHVSRSKIYATKSTFEEKCARAMMSDCAHELTALLGAICMEKGRNDEKIELYQSVLERKTDVGPVALQCLYHLSIHGTEAHRKAITTILDKGYSRDTDHIYAGAISSMLKLSDLSARDLQTVAKALHGDTADLRAGVLHAIRSLEPRQLGVIVELNHENVVTCSPFARAFGNIVDDAKVEAEVVLAACPDPSTEQLPKRRR